VTVRPVVPPLPLNPGAFGPLECPEAYTWDPGHPARVKPCHATGPAVRLVGEMQALPGVQADISLSLEDADSGETVGGPVTCRAVTFTDFAPEHTCGPFDFAAVRGRRYVVVQSWQYTGRQLLPGGTARSDPFTW
jgi:serine/threonine-protein kinase